MSPFTKLFRATSPAFYVEFREVSDAEWELIRHLLSPRGSRAMGERGGRKMGRSELFLVTIHADPRIQRLLWRPITIVGFDDSGTINDVELIEKAAILCDSCGQQVAVTERI